MSGVGVLELDPQPGLTQQDADREIGQQAWQPDTDREPYCQDRHQQHAGRGQQDEVQLVRVHGRPLVASVR
jgi:hypothetical protein